MKNSLSVIVLTHDDEERIVDCLDNLGFANEIIIIDDESCDRTVELARQYTSKIYKKSLNKNFSNQRNFALNYASCEWVLFVDSDEIISKSLREEIMSAIEKGGYSGFLIKRVDFVWGRKMSHGELSQVKLLRLARKDAGKWHGKVHETWKVVGKVGELSNPLMHVPHQNVREFVRDIDEYSSLRADELHEKSVNVPFLHILLYPLGKFIHNYWLRRGYKDGVAGLIYSMMMSFHSFLVRAKLYQLNNE